MALSSLSFLALSLVAQVSASDSTSSTETAKSTSTSSVKEGTVTAAGGQKMVAAPVNQANPYAGWLVLFLFGLVFVILVYRIVNVSLRHFRHLVSLTHDKQNFFREPHALHTWFKEVILYAPLFGRRHTTEVKLTRRWGVGIIPTRFQSLVLALIIAANIFYCTIDIPWSAGVTVYAPLLRNRTGVAAVLNCIPLVLFASRNNPLIWLLDVSYDSFNLTHRWFGRMVAIEAAAHVIAWGNEKPNIAAAWHGAVDPSLTMNAGTFSMALIAVIPILASSAIRHAFYETFVHVHQLLALAVFIGLDLHLRKLPERVYIHAVFATWALERFFRLVTIVYRNFSRTGTTATVEVLPGEAMRVTLHLARPWRMRAGQFMYLTVPSVGLWTSHPFSVAWSSQEPMTSFELADKRSGQPDLEKGSVSSSITAVTSTDEVLSSGGSHTVSAIIRARNGFTRALHAKASASPQTKITLPALVEGPYGKASSLSSYGTVLMVAGGVGITHTLPYVRSLVAGAAANTVATRRVTLLWIIQDPEHLEWVRPWMTSILSMRGRRDVLRIEIYITRPKSSHEVRSPSSTVRMYAGRPVVSEIVVREIQGALGAMAVTVCGPGRLGDDVRESVRSMLPLAEVDLLEESFSW